MTDYSYRLSGRITVLPVTAYGFSENYVGICAPQGASVRRPGGTLHFGRVVEPDRAQPIAPGTEGSGTVFAWGSGVDLQPHMGEIIELTSGNRTVAQMTVEEIECLPTK